MRKLLRKKREFDVRIKELKHCIMRKIPTKATVIVDIAVRNEKGNQCRGL